MIRTAWVAVGLVLSASLAVPALAGGGDEARIITLGGSVTEIAVALGIEDRLVARDSTSNWPESVKSLPDVGYIRALSPENVLALDPDLIVAEGDAGPPETVTVLRAAGVPLVLVPEARTPADVITKITAVAAALDRATEGAALAASTRAAMDEVAAQAATITTPRRVLFVLSLQGGRVLAGGEDSSADGIIRLAGGINAADGFAGYKPMTDEAVIAAAPDVILMMNEGAGPIASDAEALAQPALAAPPAGKAGALIRMDGMLLLGFGPRTAAAATALHQALYGAEPDSEG